MIDNVSSKNKMLMVIMALQKIQEIKHCFQTK